MEHNYSFYKRLAMTLRNEKQGVASQRGPELNQLNRSKVMSFRNCSRAKVQNIFEPCKFSKKKACRCRLWWEISKTVIFDKVEETSAFDDAKVVINNDICKYLKMYFVVMGNFLVYLTIQICLYAKKCVPLHIGK